MPTVIYSQEEYDALQEQIHYLQRQVEGLEALRPVWAQGHTDDSAAAQSWAAACAQLWKRLGAADQTEAVQKLNSLLAKGRY